MWKVVEFASKLREAPEVPKPAAAPAAPAPQDPELDEEIGELFQEYSSLLEYERAQDLVPSGMYLVPSFESSMEWHGCTFVQRGPYKGGTFKFVVALSETYPETPPEIIFHTDIFHPMVDQKTRRFQIEAFVPNWESGSDYVTCVFPHLHRALRQQKYFWAGGEPLNPEALEMLQTNPKAFNERAAECARRSSDKIYENPPSFALQFTKNPASAQQLILEQLGQRPDDRADTRVQDFADWFCDHYASTQQKARISMSAPSVETIEIPEKAELEDLGAGYAPKDGWGTTPQDEDDEDDEEAEAAEVDENERQALKELHKRIRIAEQMRKAQSKVAKKREQ
eukprot:TRINITY_DN23281_c0_g1_i1.p1 TRINITY_DN23281_c0_g1~~TRINITY_DN23281_c0_g1_i1.p1  ORF type:complete len:339 (+),score=79.51 TRINITY_DN23281_c0_g1_i1:167-1183(+)